MFLSFVDLGGPAQADDEVASLETTCFNRDLPEKLPFGGGRPHLRFVQAVPGVASHHLPDGTHSNSAAAQPEGG